MIDRTKMLLCLLGIIISTQIQWIIPQSETLNGIGFLFAIGFGWYSRNAKDTSTEELKKEEDK